LYLRILGKLAAQGDSEAGQEVVRESSRALEDDSDTVQPMDMDEKIAALHALMNMRSERAIPILQKILADRNPGKTKLREQALFLLCQHGDEEAVPLLIDIAKNDPDHEIRKQAIFWLSQNPSDESAQFLQQLVTSAEDPQMMGQAMFALSQQKGEASRTALQNVIENEKLPLETRSQAIYWLGQTGGSEAVDYLKSIYGRFDDPDIKEKILFSISQNWNEYNSQWFLDVAFDKNESIEVRKRALFWASQRSHIDLDRLVNLYNGESSREMREQVIFILSQSNDTRALDTMIKMARSEKDPKLREMLVFWIGQSKDPKAEDFLLEIINN
jgi:HEAT repeat protein